ncbi:DUF917 domain-containing protein [Saccharopolyspora sp. ASAGF58]|uniref:DUF917 domain-containing protein n=1 Tax=Saccharopolyspora sp. ASAGF58 TaxID=2719023 RepID=UPI00143FE1C4|nr:DUF917 domain-containing protein [Saccharopolyspora sp. ASAGF58]QIZ38602.1 DUF917 domain-containing protein [Saccharopolyspora sp. ASAGF58]
MWQIDESSLADLVVGARVLGSGGAGDPYLAHLLAASALAEHGPVPVFEPEELDPETTVVSVGLVGAVTAFAEKAATGEEFTEAVQRLRTHLGSPHPMAIAGYESAGANVFTPLTVAAHTGLPLVDVDGMGRGLSWLDQTSYDVAGLPICPFVLTEPGNRTVILERIDGADAERYLRTLTVLMGGWSAFAGYPMSAAEAAQYGVRRSLARARELGAKLRAAASMRTGAEGTAGARWSELCDDARHLGTGRVVEVHWVEGETYAEGSVVVWLRGDEPRPLRVESQNEFLLAFDQGKLVASVPDLICLIDTRTATPLLAEQVVPGYEVDVVVLRAPQRWLDQRLWRRVAPASFGYLLAKDNA